MFDIEYDEISKELEEKFEEKLKDTQFKLLVDELSLDDLHLDIASLEQAITEANNCSVCKSLSTCNNLIKGHKYIVTNSNNQLSEQYLICDKMLDIEYLNNIYLFGKEQSEIETAGEFYRDEKRIKILTYFEKALEANLKCKGMYLHGSFGTGKSYMMSVFIKKLAKEGYKCGIAYFPELLVQIRRGYNNYEQHDILETVKNLDVLVLDDIGSEKVTEWSRDEVLGTILQYRMEHNLFTCFTSNYNIKQLQSQYSKDKSITNALRVIDRIKFLSEEFELISKNYRK